MPGALGCSRGNGYGHISDLVEVTHKVVGAVYNPEEGLCHTAPLDVNRIDPPTHKTKWAVRAAAVRNGKGVKHRTDVLGVKFGGASVHVHLTAAVRPRRCPEQQALSDAVVMGVTTPRPPPPRARTHYNHH